MDRTDLQHDAFKLNGEYLEDLISGYVLSTDTAVNSGKVYFSLSGGKYTKVTPVGTENPTTSGWYEKDGYGYTTYKAVGRESLEKDIDSYENGTDGETLKRTNFPVREIEISYVVQGDSLADLRDKMHTLQTLLNVNEAEIIFNDDPGCYYIATPVMNAKVDDAKNAAVGTFDLVCHDPFKYAESMTVVNTSTKTDTVVDEEGNVSTVTSQVLTTTNSGGYKVHPKFKVQFDTDEDAGGAIGDLSDCGYVLFAKGGTDYSVQIGDDEEAGGSPGSFKMGQAFSKGLGSFALSNSTPSPVSKLVFQGTVKTTSSSSAPGVKADSYGASVNDKFYGPLIVYDFGSNAEDTFELQWEQVVACASSTATGRKQAGAFYVFLLNSSNQVVYAAGVEKTSTNSLYGDLYTYTQNNWRLNMPPNQLSFADGGSGTGIIKRYYNAEEQAWHVSIKVPFLSKAVSTYYDSTVTMPSVRKIAFFFGKYDSNSALYSNRVVSMRFLKGEDVANTFSSGDVATVDCNTAEITLNGEENDNLGDVGNNWEDMYLDVGENTIYVQYSDWVVPGYEPTITMMYRKRWL